MAKKKKGKIAIPYLITLFISLIFIGGGAWFIFNYFELGKDDEIPELVGRDTVEITYEDSHTVLMVIDDPKAASPLTFALMRSVPKDKDLLFVGIPANTVEVYNGKQTSISEVYGRGGAQEAANFAEQLLDIDIRRYITFNCDTFAEFCDIFGGVSYETGVKIPGLGNPDKKQHLIGSQIARFLTFSEYPDGEMQRAFNVGSVLASIVNQSDYQRIADNFELYFNTIVNMVDTNITAVDYKKYSDAIVYMFEKGTGIAKYSYMTGETAGDVFVADFDFRESLIEDWFSQSDDEPEETTAASEDEKTDDEETEAEETEADEKNSEEKTEKEE